MYSNKKGGVKVLKKLQKEMAKELFGTTKEEGSLKGVVLMCIKCKQPGIPNCYSEAGRRELQISGLCEKCFDKITGI